MSANPWPGYLNIPKLTADTAVKNAAAVAAFTDQVNHWKYVAQLNYDKNLPLDNNNPTPVAPRKQVVDQTTGDISFTDFTGLPTVSDFVPIKGVPTSGSIAGNNTTLTVDQKLDLLGQMVLDIKNFLFK